MGILDRLRRQQPVYIFESAGSEFAERVLNMDAAQLYATQPNLQAVVSFLADNIAQLPLKCYVRESDNDRRRVRDTTAALLFERPNADMTRFELFRALVSDMCVYDRAAWWLVPNADAPSGWEIRPVPPTWVKGVKTDNPFAFSQFTVQPPNGAAVTVNADEIVLFHGWRAGDPKRGTSPVEALKQTLIEQIEAARYREQVWKRGGRMASYISRPKDVEPWTAEQADRWKRDFKAAWTGDFAKEGGGIPVLEDGMTIQGVDFNAKEAQWAESVKISREECAGVYHLNPALLWPSGSMTYASVKENARALYNDTLGAPIVEIEERINAFVLPKIGAEPNEYVEMDFSAKLRGSVEEQMQSLASAVGRPFMEANEARAKLNLPALEEGSGLVIPLNVLVGGQASPYDSPGVESPFGLSGGKPETKDEEEPPRKSRGVPDSKGADAMADVFARFFKRQSKSVLPKIGKAKADGDPEWWDSERWDRELAEDLLPLALSQSRAQAAKSLKELRLEDADYSVEKTEAYLRKMCEVRAGAVNASTLRRLMRALDEEISEEAQQSTPAGVFEEAADARAPMLGFSLATAVAGWTVMETIRQAAPHERVMKTWITTSGNPRASHAAMDGETVPYGEPFSNGAMWPGDTGALDAEEVCGCRCQVEITIL